ncbi:small secreted protein [Phlyctema vagabunda]|uniref:Small secreted protein n=1 Tax=Phlyctema vagabunda TaxID=108571 RepID=A0ABR4PX31_9HELO
MQFPTTLVALGMLAMTVSATPRAYNDFQISGCTGGSAEAEAEAAFPGALNSLTSAEFSDVNTEAHCAVLAEQAFIDAQEEAGADSTTGQALAVGMIKNKVLKIYGTLQAITSQIELQGSTAEREANRAELTTKLATNIKIDQGNDGKASAAVDFTC